jgi:hypothetical protein
MGFIIKFFKEVNGLYKNSGGGHWKAFPVMLIIVFFPLFSVMTVLSWFDYKIFLAAIISLVLGIILLKVLLYFDKKYS